MTTITQNNLVDRLAEMRGLTVVEARKQIKSIVTLLKNQLVKGNKIELRGFGIFVPKARKARMAHNPARPADGKFITPAQMTVKFKAGRDLRRALNPGKRTAAALA
jgi:integration host factor subunit beta